MEDGELDDSVSEYFLIIPGWGGNAVSGSACHGNTSQVNGEAGILTQSQATKISQHSWI